MAHIRMTEHFEAPIDHVFELAIDTRRWPDWMAGGIEIKEISGPVDRVGTRIHDVTYFLGRPMETVEQVLEVERPRLLKFAGEGSGMRYTTTWHLTPAGPGTDFEAVTDYEIPGGFLGHVADRLFLEKAMERQARHALENFKALVEAKVPVLA